MAEAVSDMSEMRTTQRQVERPASSYMVYGRYHVFAGVIADREYAR